MVLQIREDAGRPMRTLISSYLKNIYIVAYRMGGHNAGEIASQIEGGTLEDSCNRLIERANEAGGYDNITVVLVRY